MEVFSGKWRKLTLLSFTVMWGLSGIVAQIQIQSSMDAIKGDRVVLRASYRQPSGGDLSTNVVLWNYVSNITQLIISYSQGSIMLGSSQFRGRVGFTSTMPSQDISLYINGTQEEDSGQYLIQVISLTNPGFTADLILDVKVPPAVPKCSLSGKPVLKGNVTLSCTSSTGKPIPMYKWRKTSPANEVFFSPMLNEKAGTLRLSNLSKNMSGKYMCTASNTAGEETCSINLEIISSTNVGKIVGATLGSVIGFIIIFLICLFFFMKRRQYNEDDMANEIKEDAQAPKRVSWAKSGMGSDIISKNGTLSSMGSSPRHSEPPLHHTNNLHDHLNNQHPPQHLQQYPQQPPSDTASIITATGSMAGYRPSSRHQGASSPNHYGYNNHHHEASSANGSSLPRPERYGQLPQAQTLPQAYNQAQFQAQFQAATPSPQPPPLLPISSGVTASNIARMGGVPIMVPAQNQAGSLV